MDQKTLLTLDEIGLKYTYDYGKGKLYTGGDKTSLGHDFCKDYDELFGKIRDSKINLLELGIFHGKSLAMWSDYFANGMIYGIDISLKDFYDNEKDLRRHGAFKNNNIKFFEQDLTKDMTNMLSKLPNMDIIIDDALHQANVQYNNFLTLFPKLNKGGYYIIEDITDPFAIMKLFSDLIACISNPTINSCKKSPSYSLATKIDSIQIKQNLLIIKKK
jgi:hypothetical protein